MTEDVEELMSEIEDLVVARLAEAEAAAYSRGFRDCEERWSASDFFRYTAAAIAGFVVIAMEVWGFYTFVRSASDHSGAASRSFKCS